MKKLVKKYGDATIINFTKEDKQIYGFDEGDILELIQVKIHKKKNINGGIKK
ncbi:hypothetical protein GF374_01055 [Candidatus Woesearchaeota archaeon]|nr:hypothetical protein [Candidatus Woesearchaeota archaeon]